VRSFAIAETFLKERRKAMALVQDTGRPDPMIADDGEAEGPDNVKKIRESYEAFATGDIPAALAMLDGQVEWSMAEHHTFWQAGPFIGPQAVLEGVFFKIMQTFDGFTVHVQRIVGCGNTVLAEVRYRATARATGKVLDAQAAHIFDFRDGKCVSYHHYTDTWQFAEVTGVTPTL
jgi:uncharacterized protein